MWIEVIIMDSTLSLLTDRRMIIWWCNVAWWHSPHGHGGHGHRLLTRARHTARSHSVMMRRAGTTACTIHFSKFLVNCDRKSMTKSVASMKYNNNDNNRHARFSLTHHSSQSTKCFVTLELDHILCYELWWWLIVQCPQPELKTRWRWCDI